MRYLHLLCIKQGILWGTVVNMRRWLLLFILLVLPSVSASHTYGTDAVLILHMDETTGNIADDNSTYDFDFTINETVVLGVGSVNSSLGTAFNFTGNGYLNKSYERQTHAFDTAGNFSGCFWMYANGTYISTILATYSGDAPQNGYRVQLESASTISFVTTENDANTQVTHNSCNSQSYVNNWTQICFNRNESGQRLTIFENNMACESNTTGTARNVSKTTSDLEIGRLPTTHVRPYHGLLDEIVIWNTSLTPEKISAHYNSQIGAHEYTVLDNCTNGTIVTLNISMANSDTKQAVVGTMKYNFDYWETGDNSINYSYSNNAPDTETLCIDSNSTSLTSNFLISYIIEGKTYEYSGYHTELTDPSKSIVLYSVDNSTQIYFQVLDVNSDPIEDAYINVLKYDIDTNTYVTTEIIKTDSQGQAIGNLVLYNTFYNFIIYYGGEIVYTEQAIRLITNTRTFILTLDQQAWFDRFQKSLTINHGLTFNNATNNFVFTWVDPAATIHNACLTVSKTNISGQYTLLNNCTEASSGIILYNIVPTNGTTYTARSYLKYDTEFILDTLSFITSPSNYFHYSQPNLALFIAALLSLTFFFIGLPHPVVSLILYSVSLIFSYLLGMIAVALPFVGGLIVLALIQIYLLRRAAG